jgi:outer membrane cobalamin receptor
VGMVGQGGTRRFLGRLSLGAGSFGFTLLLVLVWGLSHPINGQVRPVVLDTLQVQVTSRASPGLPVLTRSVQLLGRSEIEALPVRTISGLLEWATSVEVQARSPAQSDLGIRGAGFEQVLVLVNGVRMSDPQTGHFDLDLAVPLDNVDRVEVLRGPASALYGADAVGGVVNIVTTEGSDGWRGRVEGGSWGSARASGSGSFRGDGGGTVQLGGEASRGDGHRSGTDFETYLLNLSGGHPLGLGQISADLGFAQRHFGAEDFYAPYPSFEKTRSYTSALRWTRPTRSQTQLEVGASYRRHEDEFTLIRDRPEVYQNQHTSSQVGGEMLVRGGGWKGIEFALGGEVNQDILRSNSLGDRDETRGAIFGEAVAGGKGTGVLSLGVRQDWHQGFGGFFSPSLSGSLRVSPTFRVRSAFGRSFRAPTWTERYYQDPVNVGNEDLTPEKAWSGELGLDVNVDFGLTLAITGFYRSAEDLIDWAKSGEGGAEAPWETRNVESATFTGLEGDLSFSGPLETNWTLGGMFLSVDSEEAPGFTSKYALRPIEEQLNLGVGRVFGGGFSLGVNVQRAKRDGEDAYTRLDLRAGLRMGSTRLYLDANNLLDEEYPDITGSLAPGRALYVGLELGTRRD